MEKSFVLSNMHIEIFAINAFFVILKNIYSLYRETDFING